jgi:hypothetical protein
LARPLLRKASWLTVSRRSPRSTADCWKTRECRGFGRVRVRRLQERPARGRRAGPGRQDLGHHAFFRRHAHHARG